MTQTDATIPSPTSTIRAERLGQDRERQHGQSVGGGAPKTASPVRSAHGSPPASQRGLRRGRASRRSRASSARSDERRIALTIDEPGRDEDPHDPAEARREGSPGRSCRSPQRAQEPQDVHVVVGHRRDGRRQALPAGAPGAAPDRPLTSSTATVRIVGVASASSSAGEDPDRAGQPVAPAVPRRPPGRGRSSGSGCG